MQRVSECELVVFCRAAASPAGWPPPKTSLSIQKVFDCKWYYMRAEITPLREVWGEAQLS
jgi:hypothetical protein